MGIRFRDEIKSLCDSCVHAVKQTPVGGNPLPIKCRAMASGVYQTLVITSPMEVCSEYCQKNQMTLHEMTEVGYQIRIHKNGKVEVIHPNDIQGEEKQRVHSAGFALGVG